MKIDDKTRFPHPVLSDFTRDFKGGQFSADFIIEENYKEEKIKIFFDCKISEKAITVLLESKKAKFGFFVICLETHYNRLEEVDIKKTFFEISLRHLHGRVRIRPVVWVEDVVDAFESDNLHDEFGGGPIKLVPGEIIAVAEEQVIIIDPEKLAPWETIFTLAKSDEVPVGQFMVQTDEDKIKILAASSTYTFIHQLRNNSQGKPVLLNCVYFPAVMEVLSVLREPDQSIKEKRWYRTFSSKCEHLGINPENGEILKDAQKLFDSPFSRLEKSQLTGSL